MIPRRTEARYRLPVPGCRPERSSAASFEGQVRVFKHGLLAAARGRRDMAGQSTRAEAPIRRRRWMSGSSAGSLLDVFRRPESRYKPSTRRPSQSYSPVRRQRALIPRAEPSPSPRYRLVRGQDMDDGRSCPRYGLTILRSPKTEGRHVSG